MDLSSIKAVDTQNMWGLLRNFPDQWAEAMALTDEIELTIEKERIRKICLVGMGGSVVGAELIQAYSYYSCPYPVSVVQHYEIPKWIDEDTLFIGCSFSGNTEETLSALTKAQEKGAQIIGITSGGELMLRAAKEDFDYIKIPGGMPPRAALGYSFVPLFWVFQYLDLLDEGIDALKETHRLLSEQSGLYVRPSDNEALTLAADLNDTLPIIYSDAITMKPVNLRWKQQFGENAKTLAYGNTLPGMSHNEIVGWERIVHLTGRLSVIMLIDEADNKRVKKRMEIVKELIEDQTASMHLLNTRGKSRLTRMFSLIQLADWTSFYLAILNNIDPTPVTKIDLLKSKLAEA